jgi:hypothetical protein
MTTPPPPTEEQRRSLRTLPWAWPEREAALARLDYLEGKAARFRWALGTLPPLLKAAADPESTIGTEAAGEALKMVRAALEDQP